MNSILIKFIGTGVAIATPFKTDLSVDFDSIKKMVDFLIKNGIDIKFLREQASNTVKMPPS